MKKTGAQIVWECLIREGVDTVFGYPGGAILPIYDAMTAAKAAVASPHLFSTQKNAAHS